MKPRPWWVRSIVPAVATMVLGIGGAAVALWGMARPPIVDPSELLRCAGNPPALERCAAKEPSLVKCTATKPALASTIMQIAAILCLGGLQIVQSRYKDAKEDKRESADELRGCLLVLHRAVAGKKGVGAAAEGWLRITLHRVDAYELEQSLEYIGSDDADKAGRRFPIHAGLIGVVARTGEMRGFERPSDMPFTEWCDELVEKYGMTHEAAKLTREDRYSFLGVPIRSPGGKQVRAVVYLDARDPAFFTTEIANLIVHACEGLAAWIDEHYYT